MNCAACGSELLADEAGVTIGSKVVHEECAGLLGVTPPAKTGPRSTPPGPVPKGGLLEPLDSKPIRPPPSVETNGSGTFPIVLDERRRVEVPLEFDEQDLEYVFGCLDLYVRRRAKQRGA